MPNHYSNVVIACALDSGTTDAGAVLREWATGLHKRVAPVVNPGRAAQHLDAQIAAWGHKWSEYDITEPTAISGDCSAWQITFSTAWSEPHEHFRALARADLEARGMHLLAWVGLDPFDDSVEMLYGATRG